MREKCHKFGYSAVGFQRSVGNLHPSNAATLSQVPSDPRCTDDGSMAITNVRHAETNRNTLPIRPHTNGFHPIS